MPSAAVWITFADTSASIFRVYKEALCTVMNERKHAERRRQQSKDTRACLLSCTYVRVRACVLARGR